MIIHYKNKLLTWTCSVFFALPIAVMHLKRQQTRATLSFGVLIAIHIGIFWTCFPQNGIFQDQTGGQETIFLKTEVSC